MNYSAGAVMGRVGRAIPSGLRDALQNLPLARKILIVNGVVVFVTWSMVIAFILIGQYRMARQEMATAAQLLVEMAAKDLESATGRKRWSRGPDVLTDLRVRPGVLGGAIYDADGQLILGSSDAVSVPLENSASGADDIQMGREMIRAQKTISSGARQKGSVVVWMDASRIHARVLDESYQMVVIAAVGAVCVVLLVWLLLPVTLRRLGRLTRRVRQVTQEGNYTIRAELTGRDEIGELATAFNSMLDQIQARETTVRRELEERLRAQKQTAYLASHDPITGLPNRRFFEDAVTKAKESAQTRDARMAVVLVDIDNFKRINDSLGHRAGDLLLSEVGSRLRGQAGKQDIVCRVGGDEFAVIVHTISGETQADELGKQILHAIGRSLRLEGYDVILGASVGVALSQTDRSAEELMRDADTAMHEAKAAGKGLVRVFRAYMNDRVQHRLTLEQDLRKALDQDQLSLHYQPQVETHTGRVVGVEALMRWNHPTYGAISPVQFIPIAEESGLIVPLGAWALRRATQDAKAWQSQGLDGVAVSVNVSARQFVEPNFVATVLGALFQSGLPGDLLELELTESLLFDQHGTGMKSLNVLKDRGIVFAIDDFGTGYSSMAYLRRFPMKRLKIDRSFIKNIPDVVDDMAIAGAMIALGHKLGMEIVAEGVENRAQYNFLVDQACDRIQGYLFSKPLPLDELLATYGDASVESPAIMARASA